MITLENLVDKVNEVPDDILMMSRKDCHAASLDSIVLGKHPAHGGLVRMFIAWRNHTLDKNHFGTKRFTVGVHDHRYHIALRLLHGKVVNHDFHRTNHEPVDAFMQLDHYLFTSGVEKGKPMISRMGDARLVLSDVPVELREDMTLHRAPYQLHTIEVPKGRLAAWLVGEGRFEFEQTNIFTNAPSIETEGLYRPFESADEVRQHVKMFVNEAFWDGSLLRHAIVDE